MFKFCPFYFALWVILDCHYPYYAYISCNFWLNSLYIYYKQQALYVCLSHRTDLSRLYTYRDPPVAKKRIKLKKSCVVPDNDAGDGGHLQAVRKPHAGPTQQPQQQHLEGKEVVSGTKTDRNC